MPEHRLERSAVTCSLSMVSLLLLLAAPIQPADLGPLVSRPALYALRLPAQVASWYHLPGRTTASGVKYGGMTAASLVYDLGDTVTVCRADRVYCCVSVRIEDKGPYVQGRDIDLSRMAARKLGMIRAGIIQVTIKRLTEGN